MVLKNSIKENSNYKKHKLVQPSLSFTFIKRTLETQEYSILFIVYYRCMNINYFQFISYSCTYTSHFKWECSSAARQRASMFCRALQVETQRPAITHTYIRQSSGAGTTYFTPYRRTIKTTLHYEGEKLLLPSLYSTNPYSTPKLSFINFTSYPLPSAPSNKASS